MSPLGGLGSGKVAEPRQVCSNQGSGVGAGVEAPPEPGAGRPPHSAELPQEFVYQVLWGLQDKAAAPLLGLTSL